MTTDLEARFHREMLRLYEEATSFGYYATRYRQMVIRRGGLAAAKRLLSYESVGFGRLWEEDRLDLSVEALVLREPWRELFTQEELRYGAPAA